MPTYQANIVIQEIQYPVEVESFGEGPIPILITGHAQVFARHLKNAFSESGLLSKYTFYTPKLYWCTDEPLANLPKEVISKLILEDFARHLDELRASLEKQGLLAATDGKIGIYSHSFFSALAFQYAISFKDKTLFVEAEGPPPYKSEQWAIEKSLFFKANACKYRKKILRKLKVDPGASALNLSEFKSFTDTYQKMNPTLWFRFTMNHKRKIWGNLELNMEVMRHFFGTLLDGYDSRTLLPEIKSPLHYTLGMYDGVVPLYLVLEPVSEGGIGFFSKGTKGQRDYQILEKSGHWPFIEQPKESCAAFDHFIDTSVTSQSGNEKLLELLYQNTKMWKISA